MSLRLFEGEDLDAVRTRIREEVGDTGRIVRGGRIRRGGVAGFFSREWYQVEVEVDPAEGPVTGGVEERAEAVADVVHVDFSAAPAAFDAHLARVTGPDVAENDAAEKGDGHAELAAATEPEPAATSQLAPVAEPASTSQLVRVAKPEAATEHPLPPALPEQARAVVVVVGELPDADDAAAAVAGRLGLLAADVVTLPAPAQATGDEVLPVLTEVLSRRVQGSPSVLVAPLTRWGSDLERVATTVHALSVDYVLAVVPAFAKPEDLACWSERLGGVTALAVVGADGTTTPATCLDSGLPVASVDGVAADAAGLAELLAGRVGA